MAWRWTLGALCTARDWVRAVCAGCRSVVLSLLVLSVQPPPLRASAASAAATAIAAAIVITFPAAVGCSHECADVVVVAGGVWIFDPAGALVGGVALNVPVGNVLLHDGYLYVTASDKLLRVKTLAKHGRQARRP